MDEDLQKAYKIIKKEFGIRRYKKVNSKDEINNKCIMIKLDEVDSSILMYYHDKNWKDVDTILDICHHGNRFCDRCDKCDDIHRDVLVLYSYGYHGSEDEAFYNIKYLQVYEDYYMNTNSDMLNEKDFFGHCNEFEYNHDFLKFY